MNEQLTRVRRSIRPRADDTMESIARREFPDIPVDTAVAQLMGWNFHLIIPPGGSFTPRQYPLPCDIVFLEGPLES